MDLDSPQAGDLGRDLSRCWCHSAAASLRKTYHPRRLNVNALALFLHYQRLNFLVEWQDKTNIAATLIGIVLGGFLQFLMVVILINRFGDANGWDLGQIAFVFGLWRVQYALVLLFYSSTLHVSHLVHEGMFDRWLTRPRSLLIQFAGLSFNVSMAGQFVVAVGLIAYGLLESPLPWSWWLLPWLLITVFSGVVIFLSVTFLIASSSLFRVDTESAGYAIHNTVGLWMNLFPHSVYALAVQFILAFIVPWAFMSFFPSHLIYGRGSALTFGSPFMFLGPVAAVVVAGLATFVWRRGLRYYQGAGG